MSPNPLSQQIAKYYICSYMVLVMNNCCYVMMKRMRRTFKVINGGCNRLIDTQLSMVILTENLAQVYITAPCCSSKICCQGNKETLDIIPNQKGINVREELLNFHSTHYSSNLMCLTVLGRGVFIPTTVAMVIC